MPSKKITITIAGPAEDLPTIAEAVKLTFGRADFDARVEKSGHFPDLSMVQVVACLEALRRDGLQIEIRAVSTLAEPEPARVGA